MVFGTNTKTLLQEISTENDYLLLKSHLFPYHAATLQFRMCLLGNWLLAALLRIKDLGKKGLFSLNMDVFFLQNSFKYWCIRSQRIFPIHKINLLRTAF